jgi:hypothetical protein
VTVLWIYLAGFSATLVLFRACMVTRGTVLPSPPAHVVWTRQAGYSAVWPLFWAAFFDRWMCTRRTTLAEQFGVAATDVGPKEGER